MKHYSSNKMTKDVAEKFSLMGNVLGSFGNNNIRGHHIHFLETQAIENSEDAIEHISQAPFYYSWLMLFNEHVFWLLREFCFHQDKLRSDHLNLDYTKLIRVFVDKSKKTSYYSDEEIEEIYGIIINILIIRNAHVHGGFPNALPETLKRLEKLEKPLCSENGEKVTYSKDEVVEIMKYYEKPVHFHHIRNQYNKVIGYLKKAPKISIGF